MFTHHHIQHIVIIAAIFYLLSLVSCSTPPSGATPTLPPSQRDLHYNVVQEGARLQLFGQAYDISVDNCAGARDSVKNETRTQKYVIELALNISNSVAGEFGGDVYLAKAVIRDEIGAALGVRVGAEVDTSSSIQIVTPPGKKSVTLVQWKENWTKGFVEIKKNNSVYVGVLPFEVLNSLVLEQLSSKITDCETGDLLPIDTSRPTSVEVFASTVVIATTTPFILPTPQLVSLGKISIPGNSNEGIRITARETGKYIFKYLSGSYSTYPGNRILPGQLTWLTALRVFKDRPIEWNGTVISNNSDINAFDYGYSASQSEAAVLAQGSGFTISLLKGDTITLVTIDEKQYYSDNPGSIDLEVLFTPD